MNAIFSRLATVVTSHSTSLVRRLYCCCKATYLPIFPWILPSMAASWSCQPVMLLQPTYLTFPASTNQLRVSSVSLMGVALSQMWVWSVHIAGNVVSATFGGQNYLRSVLSLQPLSNYP